MEIQPVHPKESPDIHWKDWCWSWNSNTLATWCKELTHWKRPWCWERLKAGEGDAREWDGCMASLTSWTWVWANFGSWWWTGKPGVLQSMGSQSVGHNWTAELNWRVYPICASLQLIKLPSPDLEYQMSSCLNDFLWSIIKRKRKYLVKHMKQNEPCANPIKPG